MGGGDKPLRPLRGRPLLSHVLGRAAPQCAALILNANGEGARFAAFGVPVVPDGVANHPGPLAGILAALDWTAARRPDLEWVASLPGDTPFLPPDLVARLHGAAGASPGTRVVMAASGGQVHPAVALWHVSLREDLRRALVHEDERRVRAFAARFGPGVAHWPAEPVDPFFNANTAADLAEAERLAALLPP